MCIRDSYTPDPATAAGRAAALRPPPAEPQRPTVLADAVEEPRPRSPLRRWLVAGVVIAVVAALVAGVFVVRAIVRNNYYVAADSAGDVLIYRGSPADVLSFSLSEPVTRVCVEDLDQEKPTYTFISYSDECEFPLNLEDLVSGPAQSVKDVMIRDRSSEEIEGVVTRELTFKCDNALSAPPVPPASSTPPASPAPASSAPPAPRATPAPSGIPQRGATESVAPPAPGDAPADRPAPPEDAGKSCRQQVR